MGWRTRWIQLDQSIGQCNDDFARPARLRPVNSEKGSDRSEVSATGALRASARHHTSEQQLDACHDTPRRCQAAGRQSSRSLIGKSFAEHSMVVMLGIFAFINCWRLLMRNTL